MIDRERLISALTEKEWRITEAALLLGKSRVVIYRQIRHYKIKRPPEFPKRFFNTLKTHCKRGHEYAKSPITETKQKYRRCYLCERMLAGVTSPYVPHLRGRRKITEAELPIENPYLLQGWDRLSRITGVGHQVVMRWIKLYGFPPGEKHQSRGSLIQWDRREVAIWCAKNKELVERANNDSKMRLGLPKGSV